MSYTVYLSDAQILEKYHFNLDAELIVEKHVIIDDKKIIELIIAGNTYHQADLSMLKANESFYKKYGILPINATDEMEQSSEYKQYESARKTSFSALKVISEMKTQGYALRKV